MNGRLKRRSAAALIAYFLMITAASAPLAFFAGRAQGAGEPGAAQSFPSQNDTGATDVIVAAANGRAEVSCGGLNCPPYGVGMGGPLIEAGEPTLPMRPQARNNTPLQQAALSAIAEQLTGAGPGGGGRLGDPISAPLAPVMAALQQTADLGAGFSGNGGAGPSGGFPSRIIPQTAMNSDAPEPPVVVTPIPGAGWLLLSGLAGFSFAARGRKNPRAAA